MPTTPWVNPWTVQPDQGAGEPLSEALISTISDGLATLARPPAVAARRTASQSIPDSTWTAIAFTASDEWDTDSMHSTSSSPSKIIVPAGMGGIWAVTCTADVASGSTGWTLIMSVYVNGVAVQRLDRKGSTASPTITIGGATDIKVAAGDEIEFFIYQDSTSSKNVTAARATARLGSW